MSEESEEVFDDFTNNLDPFQKELPYDPSGTKDAILQRLEKNVFGEWRAKRTAVLQDRTLRRVLSLLGVKARVSAETLTSESFWQYLRREKIRFPYQLVVERLGKVHTLRVTEVLSRKPVPLFLKRYFKHRKEASDPSRLVYVFGPVMKIPGQMLVCTEAAGIRKLNTAAFVFSHRGVAIQLQAIDEWFTGFDT